MSRKSLKLTAEDLRKIRDLVSTAYRIAWICKCQEQPVPYCDHRDLIECFLRDGKILK